MKKLIAILCMFAFAGMAQAQMHDGHRGPPERPVAKCRDGSVSYRHEMTCRGHHGVKFYYKHR